MQLDIRWEDPAANRERVRELMAQLSPRPDELVVLPEMFSTGFSMQVARIAEPSPGPTEAFLGELARDYGVHVLAGVSQQGGGGKGRNVAVAVNPHGSVVARYTKMHPFTFAQEHEHYEPGPQTLEFSWRRLRVAPFICYDLRFPEVFRRAALRRVEVLAVIANWPEARAAHWRALLVARAIENQAFVVGVNRCGNDPKLAYRGDSLLVDPQGRILADAGPAEGWISAELDVEALYQYRARFPALSDIREHLLGR